VNLQLNRGEAPSTVTHDSVRRKSFSHWCLYSHGIFSPFLLAIATSAL